jgi:hypothetical protein
MNYHSYCSRDFVIFMMFAIVLTVMIIAAIFDFLPQGASEAAEAGLLERPGD